ncbi:protein of unknown function DUF147 [Acidimicrobium ferrooxidans DSM 10331]|uniref:DAC domain-containing protein n=1 Tax=Acidimicrobium ferrooxidans (strain DSM 10331 / JCM 15462 / NBRC 103882 / ICP) TaxID=525909 RepID=C7M1R0_ACIFD|nr:protein of unknown function DUF147 [Acidimicrobium ferrooxidans DSM 10331]
MEGAGIEEALRSVAPGTPLRQGLDRILLARMGALVVLGDSPEVLELCTGGFLIEAAYTPQRLFELAKMDGAIILSSHGSQIVRANVHLVPDPRLPTSETGTRHRTAERVAESVDATVVAVSEELSVISVYRRREKRTLQPIPQLLSRANQALSTLERYRGRLDQVLEQLNGLELREQVSLRDVVFVLQRAEMVRRIREEIDGYLVELGADGRLVALQAAEITLDFDRDYTDVLRDFLGVCDEGEVRDIKELLASLDLDELMNVVQLARHVAERARCVSLAHEDLYDGELLGVNLPSKGSRLLHHVPRLPRSIAARIEERVGSLHALASMEPDELATVAGVDPDWAKAVVAHLRSYE